MFEVTLYFLLGYTFALFLAAVIWVCAVCYLSYQRCGIGAQPPLRVRAVRALNPSRRWTVSVALALFGVLLLPLAPYALVKLQTELYHESVVPAARHALEVISGTDQVVDLKILSYGPQHARVLVVSPCDCRGLGGPFPPDAGSVGDIITLTRVGGQWSFTGDYETVWSDCGSADGNTFPPYRGKGEY